MTDLISNLLDVVRVRGTAYFGKNVEAPWGMDIEAHQSLCRFHLVLSGSTWVGLTGKDDCTRLDRGDFVIVPRGQAHFLDDRPGREARTRYLIPEGNVSASFQSLDRCSDTTHLLCGYFQFAEGVPLGIISRLPDLLVMRGGDDTQAVKTNQTMRLLESELSGSVPPSQAVLNRLTEILYLYAIRQWLDQAMLPGECLSALADPKLQRVLDQIHQKPATPWTVESLAQIAGQSRAAFAAYFKDAIGLTPINYIAHWRAELARKLLSEGNLALDEIADQTGYKDTNAFSRAFKRATGSSPGLFRRMSRN